MIKYDKDQIFKYAPVHGETYRSKDIHVHLPGIDSIIFYSKDHIFVKTRAIQEILLSLGGVFSLLGILLIPLPKIICNVFYDLFAKYRYKIFGKVDNCALLSPDEKKFILP